MTILITHSPFLQSQAQLVILPMTTDGNILHPVLARTKSVFKDNYETYHKKAIAGELMLGGVLLNRIAKQLTGLGVQSGGAEYVANIITQKFPEQSVSVRTFEACLKSLKPQLYDLMRYQGVRRVALLASPLLTKQEYANGGAVVYVNAEQVVQVCQAVFGDIPKITVEIHFGRDTPLPSLSDDTKNT